MTWLFDIALAVGLVVLLKPVSERLLAVRLGIAAAVGCGLAGVGIGALFANALVTGGGRPSSFAALVVFSLLGTLVAVALLRLLARPEPVRGVPHPLGSSRCSSGNSAGRRRNCSRTSSRLPSRPPRSPRSTAHGWTPARPWP
jgi:hypothetical protein